jgi:hypothetical protein
MACEHFTLPNGARGIACGPRLPRRASSCSHPGCLEPHTKLCDWPVAGGKTCDKRLCDGHAVSGGPDLDYCPGHEAGYDQDHGEEEDLFRGEQAGAGQAMTSPPDTLGGMGDAWRPEYRCLACGHCQVPAWFYVIKKLGADYRFADLARRVYCKRCRAAGRPDRNCAIIMEPTYWATPSRGKDDRCYRLRPGAVAWEPYDDPVKYRLDGNG